MSKPDDVFAFPASFAQRRLWFLEQFDPGSAAYNVPAAVRLEGRLDIDALGRSLNEIVERHESLRTSLEALDGEPVQVVSPEATIELPLVDLSHLAGEARRAEATRILREEAVTPVPLDRAPLMRAKLLRLEATEHVLVAVMHHAVTDGWSMGVFVRELAALYRAFVERKPSPLPALDLHYADYAIWQKEELTEEALAEPLGYWKRQLRGAPTAIELPADRPRPPVQSHDGGWLSVEFSTELTRKLKDLARAEGATLFMVLLAGLGALLSRYSGQKDVLIGSPIAGRNRAEVEGLIGFFVNTLVLRTSTAGDPSFREMIGRAKQTVLEAEAHQDVPFERLVHELQPERDTRRSPLFQVMLALQNAPMPALELPGLRLEKLPLHNGTSKFDLALELEEQEGRLVGGVEYAGALFEPETVERMAEHLRVLLEAAVREPQRCAAGLPLLTEGELRQLDAWNRTEAGLPEACVHELFEEQVERSPGSLALVFEREQLTFRELDRRANQLARRLRKMGVGPEVLVGVCMRRSVEMVVSLLAVLKAGGAYVPLDPDYPPERLAFMLEDAAPALVLTQQALGERLAGKAPFVALDAASDNDSDKNNEASRSSAPAGRRPQPANLAYVIYTSGSTGKPKGALLQHRGLNNLVQAEVKRLGLEAGKRVLQFASLSFDASVWELFATLASGACAVLVPAEIALSVDALVRLLEEQGVTHATLPPTVLAAMQPRVLPQLSTVVSAGEACTAELVARWSGPGRRFINAYGPTEGTVCATMAVCAPGERPTIGGPIDNVRLHVLDERLERVPAGVAGELYIGGVGLARGYLRRPGLTAERFVPDPFTSEGGLRLYRTGDLVRWLPDGRLEFLGRIDQQVKIRGFRIELGEIEAALAGHPGVREAVALARDGGPSGKRLVAYLVPEPHGGAPSAADLRAHLGKRLPEHMIPSAFVPLERMPIMPNGKIDRGSLPEPGGTQLGPAAPFVAPRTPAEEALARVWSAVLKVDSVGVHDNFFELGGDSILSLRLVAEANRAGIGLTAKQLFQSPSIAALAASGETRAPPRRPDAAPILLQTGTAGDGAHVVLAHGIDGRLTAYRNLCRHLPPELTVLGVETPTDEPSRPTLEALAEAHARRLTSEPGIGWDGEALVVVGWSFGALVAFEMGHQLQRRGARVAGVVLIDPPSPGSLTETDEETTLALLRQLGRVAGPSGAAHGSVIDELQASGWLPRGATRADLDALIAAVRRRLGAAERYRPEPLDAPLLILRPELGAEGGAGSWRALAASGIEVVRVPGDHMSMLREPHIPRTAAALVSWLGEAPRPRRA